MIRQRLLGILAALTILLLLLAVPWLLVTVGHYPTITGLPTWQQVQATFLTPDDGRLLLIAFTMAGWIAWLYLLAGFGVEIIARLRHVPTPRLRGFALPQLAAKSLVGAVVVLFASMTLHTAPAIAAPNAPASAPAQVKTPQETDSTTKTTKTTGATRYEVKDGDTLAKIAAKRLGDAERWPEIYRASKHLPRPDGSRFADPDQIQPGQALIIPKATKATGATRYEVKDGDTLAKIAAKRLGDAERWPEIYRASKHLPRPDGSRFADPDLIQPGQTLIIPGTAGTGEVKRPATRQDDRRTEQRSTDTSTRPTATPTVAPPVTVTPSPTPTASASSSAVPQQATATPPTDQAPVWSTSLGVGSVLAAGVIGLVAWRRRLQHRRGPIGGHVPLPVDDDALAEQQLRAAADPLAIETVDQALRGLARDCAAAGTPLPLVRAARLTSTQFELYLAEPAQLPAPWTGTADAAVWRFEADHQDDLDVDELHTIAAPYPSLVTIGKDTDDDPGLVFVDLEHLGSLGVTGGRPQTRQVIAALAIELASSPWADDLTVTIVGDYSELEGTLRSGRIRYVPTLDRLVETLDRRAADDRVAMAAAGVDDVHEARSTGTVPDAVFPEIVMVATPLTPRQREKLTSLVSDLPRVAIAAITTDDDPIGDWHLAITGTNAGILEPIGLAITPQMLTPPDLDRILSVIYLATHEEATLDEPSPAAALTPPAPSLTVSVTPTPIPAPIAVADQNDDQEPTTPAADSPTAVDEVTPSVEDDEVAAAAAANLDVDAGEPADAPVDVEDPDREPEIDHPEPLTAVSAADEPTSEDSDAGDDETASRAIEAAAEIAASDDGSADDASEPAAAADDGAEELLAAAAAAASGGEAAAQPSIRVLGPVPDLDHARGEADMGGRRDVSLEAIVYMALHPQATTASLDVALWPDSDNPASTRAPALSRARRWLGTDDHGDPYLAHHTYRLSEKVTTDWARFQQLISGGIDKTGTRALEEALDLVTGRPFSGIRTQSRTPRYTWAEPIRQRMIEAITSVSYELAQRRWLVSDWLGVEAALVRGIEVEPALEHLWRLRIRAAVKRKDAAAVQEAITRMTTLNEKLGVDLDPETEELLKAIRQTRILEKTR